MNFADLRFWLLLVPGLLALVLWQVAMRGRDARSNVVDRALLAVLSLGLFYAASPSSFVIFLAELFVNFLLAVRIAGAGSPGRRRAWLAVAVVVDVAALAWFKYDRFVLVDLLGLDPAALQLAGLSLATAESIPPGISFYTFQMIAFAVDTARAPEKRASLAVLDYVCFTAFFPQIVAGPIERRADLWPQVSRFRASLSWSSLDAGLRVIAVGMFMKLVLADHLAAVGAGPLDNAWGIALSCVCFGLRIYFDFAGYSLIAVGLGKLLGVELTLNFLAPYFSRSLPDLWRRWHVTLSGWFRDYVYVPLGGRAAPARNLLIVFGLSGLWHGAGLNFIVWGLVHGTALVLHRLVSARIAIPGWVDRALMLVVVFAAWLPFMQTDPSALRAQVTALVTPAAYAPALLVDAVPGGAAERVVLAVVLALSAIVLALEGVGAARDPRQPYAVLTSRPVAMVLLMLALLLRARGPSPFIYFAF